MKLKIHKESENVFVITLDKISYEITISISHERIAFSIQEKENKIIIEKYRTSFTFETLFQISQIFKIFNSLEEAFLGIKSQLESGLIDLRKEGQDIFLSLYVFGRSINFVIPLSKGKSESDSVKESDKDAPKYREKIKKLESELEEKNFLIESFKSKKGNSHHFEIEEKKIQLEIINNKLTEILLLNHYNPSSCILARTINDNTSPVNSMILLSDNRIASCSDDNTIRIYNIETFINELTIKETSQVLDISLFNDKVVASTYDHIIKVYDIQKDKYSLIKSVSGHKAAVVKSIQLTKNRLCSCSLDGTIKVWDSSFNCLKTIYEHNSWVICLIETKNDGYIVSAGKDNKVIFWNNEYKKEKVFDDIQCTWNNCMIEIDFHKLVVGGNQITIINLNNMQIDCVLNTPEYEITTALLEMGEQFLCAGLYQGSYSILMMAEYGDNYEIFGFKKQAHPKNIKGFLRIKENSVASYSEDNGIRIWVS